MFSGKHIDNLKMTQSFVPLCLLVIIIVLRGQVLATSLFPKQDDYYVEKTDQKGIVVNCSSSTPEYPITVNGTRIVVSAGDHNMYKFYFQQPEGASQVRLDFIGGLEEAGPSGDCLQEYFQVRSSPTIIGNNQRLVVCGSLIGQHMYLSFESDRIMAQLKKNSTTTNIEIIVTFIPEGQVPQYCLQFYKDEGSMIQSFGYPQQLNNQYYTICIDDRSVGLSGLEIRQCSSMTSEPFFISGMIPNGNATTDCPYDWIQIFGENRVCGSRFNTVMRPGGGPYLIGVNFNDQELYDIDSIIAQVGGKPGDCPDEPAICGIMLEEDIMNTGFCLMLSSA